MQIDIEVLTTTRHGGVIWGFKSQLHQRKYRSQKALRLAQWQLEDEGQCKSRFDRVIGELSLSPTQS